MNAIVHLPFTENVHHSAHEAARRASRASARDRIAHVGDRREGDDRQPRLLSGPERQLAAGRVADEHGAAVVLEREPRKVRQCMIEGVEGRPGTARTAGPSSSPTTSVASRCAVPPRKLDGASFGRRSAIHAAIAPAPTTNSSRKLSFPIPAWSMTFSRRNPNRRKDGSRQPNG